MTKDDYEPLENPAHYEVDIAPDEFTRQYTNHKKTIEESREAIKKAEDEISKLTYSSFTHQSYMRARKHFPESF